MRNVPEVIYMACLTSFVFTLNNYDDSQIERIKEMDFQYLIYGFEVGKKGTPHLQGYMELKKKKRVTSIKKFMPRAHIEMRKGSQIQAAEYCKKEGNFVELGEMKKQGRRTDLDGVREAALEGGMRAVTSFGSFQQINVAKQFLIYNEPERDFKPEVIWIYGPTGRRKSWIARKLLEGREICTKNYPGKWWNNYDGHEAVIIDDFRSSWWELEYMLALLDRYPFQVEFKGGFRQMLAKTIIVTAPFPPHEAYPESSEDIQQLVRRVDYVEFVGPASVHDVPEVGGNTNTPTSDIPEELYNEDAMTMLDLILGGLQM